VIESLGEELIVEFVEISDRQNGVWPVSDQDIILYGFELQWAIL
jgi:hypothetical protein